MTRRKWLAAGIVVALLIVLAAVAAYRVLPWATGGHGMLAIDATPLVVETRQGARSFTVEIADDPGEREQGLMFRRDMADDHGMLFVFPETQDVGFWMKNTILALDLIFIDADGRIRAIRRGEPMSLAAITPGVPVRFVLELKAGIAQRNGISEGDIVRHPEIESAAGG